MILAVGEDRLVGMDLASIIKPVSKRRRIQGDLPTIFCQGPDWEKESGGLDDVIRKFLSVHEVATTRRQYDYKFKRWIRFMNFKGRGDDIYLRLVLSDEIRLTIWLHFIMYLFEKEGVKGQYLEEHLAAVKKNLSDFVGTSFAESKNHPEIRRVINSCGYSVQELVQRDFARQAREKLPMPDAMITFLQEHLWRRTVWDWLGIFAKGTWLAIIILMIRGVRISSVCVTNAEHELLTSGVYLYFVSNGERIRHNCGDGRWPVGLLPGHVDSVELRNMSSKTTAVTSYIVIDRDVDVFSAWCVEVIADWAYHFRWNLRAMDPFVAMYRYQPGTGKLYKRFVQPSSVNVAIKASALYYGLPPDQFTSTSCRKRVAMDAGTGDLTWEHINKKAGWVSGSVTGLRCYSHASVKYKSGPSRSVKSIQHLLHFGSALDAQNLLVSENEDAFSRLAIHTNDGGQDLPPGDQSETTLSLKKVSWSLGPAVGDVSRSVLVPQSNKSSLKRKRCVAPVVPAVVVPVVLHRPTYLHDEVAQLLPQVVGSSRDPFVPATSEQIRIIQECNLIRQSSDSTRTGSQDGFVTFEATPNDLVQDDDVSSQCSSDVSVCTTSSVDARIGIVTRSRDGRIQRRYN
jgi:hypothetical protein